MKKLILINQTTGYLTIDTVNAYATSYEEVILVAGTIEEAERKLSSNVRLKKIIAYNKSSALKRIITWLIAFIQIFIFLLFKNRKYEVVYVTNPPLSYLASLLLKHPYSIIVYDSYPDALRNVGIKEGHWLYEMWSKWNRKLFKKARCIYTLSEGMALQLTNYIERGKIKVIPLWPASDTFAPIDKKNNSFAKENGLENKFVVLYSGNMGYTHNVDVLVDVADILKDNEDIHFLFIGDGKKKQELIKSVSDKKLTNCTFLDWQPYDVLPYSLAAADLGVVTLNNETALTSVPSKTFNLLAVGAPLLCIAPENAEISLIVNKYKNGGIYSSLQQKNIAEFILTLYRDKGKQKQMSLSSLQASKEFTKENAYLYLK